MEYAVRNMTCLADWLLKNLNLWSISCSGKKEDMFVKGYSSIFRKKKTKQIIDESQLKWLTSRRAEGPAAANKVQISADISRYSVLCWPFVIICNIFE